MTENPRDETEHIAFIGGGNMAEATIRGLLASGYSSALISVVEPAEPARDHLRLEYGIHVEPAPGQFITSVDLVIWAVEPQVFALAAGQVSPFLGESLHLSFAAGITTTSMTAWLDTDRIVRGMPNTPVAVGLGTTGLFRAAGVSSADQQLVESVVAATGAHLWVESEELIESVTAVSGSGPAYVFYLLESMAAAGVDMGLAYKDAYSLATTTVVGAAHQAQLTAVGPEELRERVTSKNGTTHAAIVSLERDGVKNSIATAMRAARDRGFELGREYGSDAK